MNAAGIIAVDRDLSSSGAKHCSLAGLDLLEVAGVARGEPVLVLFADVQVLLQIFRRSAELDARRIVELGPLVLATLDQLVEDNAGNRAVCHSVPGVSGRDVDMLIAARISPDVGHVVDWLHHLTRPPILHGLDHWKALAGPLFEALETLFSICCLTRFVVLATDDQDVVIELTSSAVLTLLYSDVVIGIRRIPIECMRYGPLWNPRTDDVRPICRLLAVDDEPVIDWGICAHHHVVGADYVTLARRHLCRLAIFDLFGMHASVDFAAVTKN